MKRDYTDYLRDILTAIGDAQSFTESLDLDDFLASKEKQYAVVRALEIIGEAAAQIPTELCVLYPAIPWREMVGMRNVVIHNYSGVDETVIWRTVQDELPLLKKNVTRMLRELSKERGTHKP
jgi:uncharacterized protein with HEPN domain